MQLVREQTHYILQVQWVGGAGLQFLRQTALTTWLLPLRRWQFSFHERPGPFQEKKTSARAASSNGPHRNGFPVFFAKLIQARKCVLQWLTFCDVKLFNFIFPCHFYLPCAYLSSKAPASADGCHLNAIISKTSTAVLQPCFSYSGFLFVGTWLSLVEHSLGVRGVGSSNLPVPTKLLIRFIFTAGSSLHSDQNFLAIVVPIESSA
jgi:hypothetical protein